MIDRERLRKNLKTQRKELSQEAIEKSSALICAQLTESPLIKEARVITAYLPFQNEVDIRPFIQDCLTISKTVLIPHFQNDHYCFSPLATMSGVKKGGYGIFEPEDCPLYTLEETQVMTEVWIVPGVAFDKNGNRLGMGMGYYDQFLKEGKGLKLGVCYPFQFIESIPTAHWDVPMDAILTDQGTKWITR